MGVRRSSAALAVQRQTTMGDAAHSRRSGRKEAATVARAAGESWAANSPFWRGSPGGFSSFDEITMKYYFNDYLIPKLKDIIKILLFNGNKKYFGKISLDFRNI